VSAPTQQLGLPVVRASHPSTVPSSRVRFAHPSEQQFAWILDIHDIVWEYEPVEFVLAWSADGSPCSGFRPDFWLPEQRCFVELTTADQRLVTRKNAKIRRLRELYPEVSLAIVYQRDFLALLSANGLELAAVGAA
jgi:hypoxanthine phosphoribosyltransferase